MKLNKVFYYEFVVRFVIVLLEFIVYFWGLLRIYSVYIDM